MKHTRRSEAATARDLIEKPAFALVPKEAGHAVTPEVTREDRIREAAYARFEARGGAHGHDLDDWLAAEAALAADAGR